MAWIEYNVNPFGSRVGDCSVRAVCKALDETWEKSYARIALEGFLMGDMPSSDAVWGNVLMRNGFRRKAIISDCQDCYTAEDFWPIMDELMDVVGAMHPKLYNAVLRKIDEL